MPDISGYGVRVNVQASNTFPDGFDLSAFADDADPFDLPSMQIKDKAMGLNGDLITWSKATPLELTLAVLPGTEDAANMAALFEANRVGKGKSSARDTITVTGVYPDGSTITLTEGAITDGPPGSSIASAGRIKTNSYKFAFENVASTEGTGDDSGG